MQQQAALVVVGLGLVLEQAVVWCCRKTGPRPVTTPATATPCAAAEQQQEQLQE